MTPALKSIRWQIQIWYGLLLLVIVGAFAIFIHRLTWRDLLGKVDQEIRQNNSLILGNLRRSALAKPSLQSLMRVMHSNDENAVTAMVMEWLAKGELDANADLPATFAGRDPGYAYFAIFDPGNRLIASSANAPARIEPPPIPIQGTAITARTTEDRREQGLAEQSGFRLVIGQDLSPEKALMTRYRLRIVAGASATWLVVLVGGWWIAGAVIRPIRTISDAAARIAHGNLKERIPLTNSGNELHDLAMVLNDTFQRLDEAFERQRQFTADASHELRTPVTVILCEAQRMQKKARSVEEYAEAMALCYAAGRRMQKLVENLLVLARQDGEEHGLVLESAELKRLIDETVEAQRPLAMEKAIEVHTELEPIFLQTDVLKLSTLLNNIIGNAIAHHHGRGHVWVTARSAASTISISVRDDGPGIGSEHLPHIFERFYQVDKSRSSAQSHNGLGLAVSQSIAAELGGGIAVKSEPGKGSEFVVTLGHE